MNSAAELVKQPAGRSEQVELRVHPWMMVPVQMEPCSADKHCFGEKDMWPTYLVRCLRLEHQVLSL